MSETKAIFVVALIESPSLSILTRERRLFDAAMTKLLGVLRDRAAERAAQCSNFITATANTTPITRHAAATPTMRPTPLRALGGATGVGELGPTTGGAPGV